MCLTIPAQIVSVDGNTATISKNGDYNKIDTTLIQDPKPGDWILYISDFAINKISEEDAKEIIDLLQDYGNINTETLSGKFLEVIKSSQTSLLAKEDIIYLLNTEGVEKEALLAEGNIIRKTFLKDFYCIHGIIEFSNYCTNDCLYCGLRKENKNLQRYRMSPDEIVNIAVNAVQEKGYKLLVLQSGEDFYYSDETLVNIIKQIKQRCRVFIFISIGERGHNTYKKLKEAGASGVLFRFETANPVLFKKLHPNGKNFEDRFNHLNIFKELGYFIATGSLIGLPDQTLEDIANDILVTKKYANMVSTGPFIPSTDTPLADYKPPSVDLVLKVIAITRLVMRNARIPVTTALETLDPVNGRMLGLKCGANSLMFNLTPPHYRQLYKLYDNKFYQDESTWEKYGLFKLDSSYKMLEEKMLNVLEDKEYEE